MNCSDCDNHDEDCSCSTFIKELVLKIDNKLQGEARVKYICQEYKDTDFIKKKEMYIYDVQEESKEKIKLVCNVCMVSCQRI